MRLYEQDEQFFDDYYPDYDEHDDYVNHDAHDHIDLIIDGPPRNNRVQLAGSERQGEVVTPEFQINGQSWIGVLWEDTNAPAYVHKSAVDYIDLSDDEMARQSELQAQLEYEEKEYRKHQDGKYERELAELWSRSVLNEPIPVNPKITMWTDSHFCGWDQKGRSWSFVRQEGGTVKFSLGEAEIPAKELQAWLSGEPKPKPEPEVGKPIWDKSDGRKFTVRAIDVDGDVWLQASDTSRHTLYAEARGNYTTIDPGAQHE
jgi:hypothetical protein